MGGRARTASEIIDDLYRSAVINGECIECHLRPSIDRNGRERQYVQVGGRNGKKWGVPRLVLHVRQGPLPDDVWALHTCDNTKCIREEHLFKGTAQDNTDDMIAKGRKVDDPTVGQRRREATEARIKPLYDQGLTNSEIADRLRLSHTTVWSYTVTFSARNQNAVRVGLDLLGASKDVP
jgi:hypothetical protein